MWRQLAERWRSHREGEALRRRAIADDLWKRTLIRYPFLQRRDDRGGESLRRLTSLFLDAKEFTAVGDMRLRNDVVVAVAAQACLPVLQLGLDAYRDFVGIVLHADEVVANRSRLDDDGIVHEYDEALTGEVVDGGPVMLSWRDVRLAGQTAADGYNVVVHECAHVLDRAHGLTRPVTAAATGPQRIWHAILEQAYGSLCEQLAADEATALDPYGAESISEFFAVASESFFVAPQRLQASYPALYAQLRDFYRQDPLQDTPAPR